MNKLNDKNIATMENKAIFDISDPQINNSHFYGKMCHKSRFEEVFTQEKYDNQPIPSFQTIVGDFKVYDLHNVHFEIDAKIFDWLDEKERLMRYEFVDYSRSIFLQFEFADDGTNQLSVYVSDEFEDLQENGVRVKNVSYKVISEYNTDDFVK